MHDARRVGARQAAGDLLAERHHVPQRHGAALDVLLQRAAFVQRHRDEDTSIAGLFDVVDGADVRIVERRGSLRLVNEALPGVFITRQAGGQELQRDEALEANVLRLVDDPHRAAAELFENLIVRNSFADHWGGLRTDSSREWRMPRVDRGIIFAMTRTITVLAAIVLTAAAAAAQTPAPAAPANPPMILTIAGWPDGDPIPVKFTQAGEQFHRSSNGPTCRRAR